MSTTFDLDSGKLRRLGYQAVDLYVEHLAGLRDGPVYRLMNDAAIERLMLEPLPETGQSPEAVLDEFRDAVLPYPMGNNHPRFFGWVNSTATAIGPLAELLAAGMNPSVAGGNHAAVYVERAVLAWIKALLGYPPTSMGLLVSGGSMANLTGLAVARHVKAGFDVRKVGMQAAGEHGRLVMYTSTESHSCIQKAAELLGIGSDNLRKVAVDDEFRMDVADLVRQIEADRAAGLRPLCVAASLGTVNTGAIDPLADIAEICRRFDLWFHIDGAYGGFAALVPEIRCQVAALAEADSLAVDPHKWLFIPVEAGCALVKDAAAMRDAFSLVPPYLRTEPTGFGGLPWFSEYGVQQSRGFRALKLWMSLKQIGAERYRQMIASNVELAHYLHRRVSETPELEVMAPAPLSIVCFRYVPPGWSGRYAGADLDARLDELNRRLVPAIQVDGRVFVTNAVLRGRFVLRACIVNYRTQREDLDLLVETVLELGQQIAQGHT